MHERLVGALASAPETVADVVESLSVGALMSPPTDLEWSAAQIIGHVRAADAIWRNRILLALVRDGIAQPSVDERMLQAVLDASGLTIGDQVTAYAFGRAELVGILTALRPDEWSQTFHHPDRGMMTIVDACHVLEAHEREHLAQLATTAVAVQQSFQPRQ